MIDKIGPGRSSPAISPAINGSFGSTNANKELTFFMALALRVVKGGPEGASGLIRLFTVSEKVSDCAWLSRFF
jgi:hypothetical protein